MARTRRELRPSADIWPGFVDALSTLLLVIIFLLVVFVLGQFFLSQLLQGKDSKLQSLEQAIAQLTEQLDLEQTSNAELRLAVSQLTSDLQSAGADRADATAVLAEVAAERDEFRDRLLLLEDEQSLLTQTLNDLRAEADSSKTEVQRDADIRARLQDELDQARQTIAADKETIEAQLAQLIQLNRDVVALQTVRDELEVEVTETVALLEAAEAVKAAAETELTRLADLLVAAEQATADLEGRVNELTTTAATRDTEAEALSAEAARLSELLRRSQTQSTESAAEAERLSAELETVTAARSSLESELARLTELLSTAETESGSNANQVAELTRERDAAQAASDERASRIADLTERLDAAQADRVERESRIAELTALLEAARSQREGEDVRVADLEQARAQLLAELTQVRDRSSEIEAKLVSEQERTALVQRELEQRELRLTELLRSASRAEQSLASEQIVSRRAFEEIDTLNRQINALRVQLAAIQEALEIEEAKVQDQQITIADLGSKLNVALAGKVQELSRFRSEFFGRLREVLGDRPDVRIVGDRFVFQSEVLFSSASAEIEPGGEGELEKLAQSLRDISAEIPTDLPWVLQINGHTDRRPISTRKFPSNWELSAARAINVGKFLIDEGVPPGRIAVAGFADFQPLDDRRDEIAYRRNRRIEIKLTTR